MRAKYVSIEVATARGIAARWRSQRCQDDKWLRDMDSVIHDRLCGLEDTASIKEASDIIGNQSWTYISCDGCSDYVERAVRLGDTYSEGKRYCATCIAEAHQVLIGDQK